jgi:hypothetical protein
MRRMVMVVRWFTAGSVVLLASLLLGMPALGMVLAAHGPPRIVLHGAVALSDHPPAPASPASAPPLAPASDVTAPAGTLPRIYAGSCYREQFGAIIHVHLEGRAEDFGYAQGMLIGDRVARIETDMMHVFVERVPSFWARHMLLGLVNWNDRNLPDYFTGDELREIAAITQGHGETHDPYLGVSPSYGRGLQYHALHDISQYLIDNPLVHPPQIGCTAVVVAGARSQGGHLLVGRLFDFEGGECFDVDKIVYTVTPDQGHRFLSVCWGGMAGAVTGLNDAKLWVSINAAATDGQAFIGRPIVMVVREILQHCATIDQALTILEQAKVFVSDGVLLVSGAEHRAVVAEKGPHHMGVREMADDRLVLTNHFLSPVWKLDHNNTIRITDGTTVARMDRALDLIDQAPLLDPAGILAICRDHRGAHGVDVGFGNRSTINAWIGAHLVVADVSSGVVWVCEPWHGLGRALPFDINGPRPDLPILPRDADYDFVASRLVGYRGDVTACKEALQAHDLPRAQAYAQRLLAANPRSFEACSLAAEASSDPQERHRLLELALTLQPAYASDRQALRTALQRP